jgi:hypothetical protein
LTGFGRGRPRSIDPVLIAPASAPSNHHGVLLFEDCLRALTALVRDGSIPMIYPRLIVVKLGQSPVKFVKPNAALRCARVIRHPLPLAK